MALERIAQQSGQLFYSSFIIAYGTTAYAAHQIGLSIESLSFMPGAGMGIAAATLMGQALGAGKLRRARISHNEALRLAVGVMTVMALLFFFAPHFLIGLFSHDPDVIEKGSVFLKLVAFAQVPLAISFVYAGSLRGTGDTFYVFIVTLVAMWGIRVALSWVASSWLHLSLYAVWGVFLIDWYFRGAAFAWRYHAGGSAWVVSVAVYARSSPAKRSSSFFGPTELNQTTTFCPSSSPSIFLTGTNPELAVTHFHADVDSILLFRWFRDHFNVSCKRVGNGGQIVNRRNCRGDPLGRPIFVCSFEIRARHRLDPTIICTAPVIQQFGRNILEKTRWRVALLLAEQVSPAGVQQVEPLAGTGHADVTEAPFLLHAVQIIQ